MDESPPISLDLRMEKKRRRTRLGTGCVIAGILMLGVGGFGLARGGADVLGVWGLVLGLGLTGFGVYTLRRASTQRW